MNTDDQNSVPVQSSNSPTSASPVNSTSPIPLSSVADPLVDLVQTMQSVNTSDPKAEANVTSIDDNNGGRIELNDESVQAQKDDQTFQKVIK